MVKFTFQEVLSGDEAFVVFAEARRSVQQEVGAFVLVDAEQDLCVFEVARVEHGLGSVGHNLAVHNGHERKPEEGGPWQDLIRTGVLAASLLMTKETHIYAPAAITHTSLDKV